MNKKSVALLLGLLLMGVIATLAAHSESLLGVGLGVWLIILVVIQLGNYVEGGK
jgi:hypothetical protein